MEITTIQVSSETWQYLNRQKRPGESFDDVLRRELGIGVDDSGDGHEPDKQHRQDEQRDTADLPAVLEGALAGYRKHCETHDQDRADERVAAARAIVQLLVAGGVGKSQAQNELLPEYSVPEQSPETWWDKQGKRFISDIDGVRWVAGRNEYVFDGDD